MEHAQPQPGAQVQAAPFLDGGSTFAPRIGKRSYMSGWLLRSALTLRDAAAEIEAAHPGEWSSPHVEKHLDLVVPSVLNASTFLEAMINELYTDASEGHGTTGDGYLAPLHGRTVASMAAWWQESNQGVDRTFAKYQLLLTFDEKEPLDRGTEPYQSAAALLVLRNAIVHYRPATVYSDAEHELDKRLRGRFVANALLPTGNTEWWPNGALGAGCATWAIESAEKFADEVVARVGIVPNYQRLLRGAKPPPSTE